jgi:hypothetical protein
VTLTNLPGPVPNPSSSCVHCGVRFFTQFYLHSHPNRTNMSSNYRKRVWHPIQLVEEAQSSQMLPLNIDRDSTLLVECEGQRLSSERADSEGQASRRETEMDGREGTQERSLWSGRRRSSGDSIVNGRRGKRTEQLDASHPFHVPCNPMQHVDLGPLYTWGRIEGRPKL